MGVRTKCQCGEPLYTIKNNRTAKTTPGSMCCVHCDAVCRKKDGCGPCAILQKSEGLGPRTPASR